jgi:hypothetical protein
MTVAIRIVLAMAFGAALFALGCYQDNHLALTKAVRQVDRVVLYEGLPHQMFESHLLKEERRNKAIQELNSNSFYQEPLPLPAEDAKQLSAVLGESATYKPFSGEKMCGGFHPDYAVEWHVGRDRHRALICFGCREVKLFGPGLESRHDLDRGAYEKLRKILKDYRKNRPSQEDEKSSQAMPEALPPNPRSSSESLGSRPSER